MGYYKDICDGLSDSQDLIVVGVGAIVLDEEGRVLVCKRSDNALWSLPGGCLEPGEGLEECIIRELFEETGIVVKTWDLVLNKCIALKNKIMKGNREIYVTTITYRVESYDKTDFKLNDENVESKWAYTYDIVVDVEGVTEYTRLALV